MALRPVSPVQLVTRALRSVGSAYQTSAWYADRFRGGGQSSEPALPWLAVATGTDYAGSTGAGVRHLQVRGKYRYVVVNSSDRTTFGEPGSSARH